MGGSDLFRVCALVWRIYGFALVMLAIAIIPGFNFLYSGHGGPAWLAALLVLPVTATQLWRYRRKGAKGSEGISTTFLWASLAAYVPLSFAAATLGAASIKNAFGLPVRGIDLWLWLNFPLSLPFMWGK